MNTATKILVFTDGSYIKKSNKCGYGVYFPNGEIENLSKKFKRVPLTNQRAELYAIYKAIKAVQKKSLEYHIKIYTDSEYSIKSLTIWIKGWKENGWKSSTGKDVMNQDLIRKIDLIITKHVGKIEFQHVRSHTGKSDFESKCNDIVDKLAKNGGDK